ncbi:hypothetical protein PMAYCL1PPCAC_13761, partial [Pristionchus mayeri]
FQLMDSGRTETGTNVCVFLEEGLPPSTDYLGKIFVQDQFSKTKYSLYDIASSASHCVKGGGEWQMISDKPSGLSCDKEIAIIFTSDDKTEYVLATRDVAEHRTRNGRVTFVSPWGGMKIVADNIQADLTVYTGGGVGTSELLYPLKTWSSPDVPRYFDSFDNVLTFVTKSNDFIYQVTSEYRNTSTIQIGEKTVILTSGKSDNVMNLHPEENYLRYSLLEAATANVNGSLSLDPSYKGYINFTVRGDYMNEERSFTEATIDWHFYASYFEVKYLTSVRSEDIWLNEDTFVIEIDMSDLPTDITPIPGLHTDAPPAAAGLSDNYCKCGFADDWFDDWDPATIWVDVIIILDTSQSMGKSLDEAKSVVTSFVGLMSTDTTAEFYSRIGVIAVADTAEVIYNLNMSSSDDLNMVKQHKIDKIDIEKTFQGALTMFADGTKASSYRENAQQIIYFLTTSATSGILNGVDDFKTGGGIIIVNDFILEETVPDPGLQKLASDGFFFTDLSENYISSLGVFCEANCFCSPDAHPFNDDDWSIRTRANRGCFHPVNNGIPLQKARETCQKEGRYLVSIHDQEKELFVNGVASIFGGKKKYWLGYQHDGNEWIWDDKSTNPYASWDSITNQPDTKDGKNLCAYALQGTGFNVNWTATNCGSGGIIYVCESPPCSIGYKDC